MIIVCKNTASQEKINELIAELEEQNLKVHCSNGTLSTILGIVTMLIYKPNSWCVYCPMGTMTQGICIIKDKIEF